MDRFNLRALKLKVTLLAGLSLFAGSTQALALTTLTGTDFDVVYDSSLMGLFGSPTLSGNTLFFTPTNFVAESLNGAGEVLTRSTINVQIIAHNNTAITSLGLTELGDYKLKGANSAVDVSGETRAFAISNPSIREVQHITSNSNLTINDGKTHDWEASSFISLTTPKWQGVTSINYTLENILDAYTEITDVGPKLAFIEKKFAGTSISLVVTTVPEADTYAMLLAGMGIMGMIFRRKLG
jgi:hypothetical protein